jgi:hypothetical protein
VTTFAERCAAEAARVRGQTAPTRATEAPESRKARQDAAVSHAAEVALAKATASGDPSQVKTAIEAMAKAREFCGGATASSNVTIVLEGLDPDDDRDDEPAATSQIQ